jgi:hypothetical protein
MGRAAVKTPTEFQFRIDICDDTGNEIVEHLAAGKDFDLAEASYRLAIRSRPYARITLRQGERVLRDSGPRSRRVQLLTELAEVEQRIAEREVSIAKQIKLITSLEGQGHDTAEAKDVLALFRGVKQLHEQRRRYLIRRLENPQPESEAFPQGEVEEEWARSDKL